jgi:hypothetical protein
MSEEITEEIAPEAGAETEIADDQSAGKETGDEQAKESSDGDKQKAEADGEGSDEEGEVEVFTAESFEMPEGIEVDQVKMDEFLELANNSEMTAKEKNQAFINLYSKRQTEAVENQTNQWEEVRKEWREASEKHEVYGGKNYKENKAVMLQTLSHFGNKDLVEMGNHFGWMDNPDFQLFLYKVGGTLSEDQLATGKIGKSESIESRWYGDDGDKK